MVPLSFARQEFRLIAPAALFWPAQNALLVADLHLEKASFYARQGQMLPPYDSQATLEDLAKLVRKTGAERVFCLGDNFHDEEGEGRLEPRAAELLTRLTRAVKWVWISGNHDRDVSGRWGGEVRDQWCGGGLALRHEATSDTNVPEISGHYHPKLRVPVRGRHVSRRCFVQGRKHLIMPAFGALTGGLAANHQEIFAAVGGPAEAIIGLKQKLVRFDLGFPIQAAKEEPSAMDDQLRLPLALASQ